ncbi:MAG: hypothetical protein OJF49_001022 [Ktedonobacterales bacterium]|nr:MAG: hypothetical protein OJF49_001022 [Ktedonobacterales bacterium]
MLRQFIYGERAREPHSLIAGRNYIMSHLHHGDATVGSAPLTKCSQLPGDGGQATGDRSEPQGAK